MGDGSGQDDKFSDLEEEFGWGYKVKVVVEDIMVAIEP